MSQASEDPELVPIRPAATVIPLRDGGRGLEVLVLRRDTSLAFHGGSWVFPGGRVDEHELRHAPDDLTAAKVAATREAHEEAGLSISTEDLVTLSHWTTPLGRNRRFATWFFVVAAPEGEVVIDDGEIRAYQWHAIGDAITGCEQGRIALAGPTYVSLLRLRPYASTGEALHHISERADEVFLPRLVRRGSDTFSVYQDDPAYDTGDLDSPGAKHRMQMLDAGYRYSNEIDPV